MVVCHHHVSLKFVFTCSILISDLGIPLQDPTTTNSAAATVRPTEQNSVNNSAATVPTNSSPRNTNGNASLDGYNANGESAPIAAPQMSFAAQVSLSNYVQNRPPGHSRNSSLEMRMTLPTSCSRSSQDLRGLSSRVPPGPGHSRAASLDLRHARNSSADLNKLFRNDVGLVFGASSKCCNYNRLKRLKRSFW